MVVSSGLTAQEWLVAVCAESHAFIVVAPRASSDVAGPERRLKRFRHPSAGPLTLHSTSLLVAGDPMTRIVILYPATASDAARLERLGR
jgi:MmyB-like transcription regulator ligand binding domain